jgi:hypothetical protein
VSLAEVDGGTSVNVGRVIGNFWNGAYSATNYAASDKAITRGTPALTAIDGDTTHNVSNLQGTANQSKYGTNLSWTFGVSGWKWLSGYNYPVLDWQTVGPDVELDNLGIGFTWP